MSNGCGVSKSLSIFGVMASHWHPRSVLSSEGTDSSHVISVVGVSLSGKAIEGVVG